MPVLPIEELIPEASDPSYLAGLEKEFQRGWELEKVNYMARQMQARQQEAGLRKNVDGLGQLTAVIDARTYFRWLQEDPHFWEDKKNTERFLRDNPECRAQAPEKRRGS